MKRKALAVLLAVLATTMLAGTKNKLQDVNTTETEPTEETKQEIITHGGDRYVINVEAMKPDGEMTLMDLLLACPEVMAHNGKRLTDIYEIRVDNVPLAMDDETVLQALRAEEISTIEVYTTTATAVGGGGDGRIIDIYMKQQEDGRLSGKLTAEGSTRGNGKAYADFAARTGHVTLRGFALGNFEYAKGHMTDDGRYSSRQGIENLHLNADWDISDSDNLKIKLFQTYLDAKQRLYYTEAPLTVAERDNYLAATATYGRTLNERGATLLSECGTDRLTTTIDETEQVDRFSYLFAETSQPLLNEALNVLAGWEIDFFDWHAQKTDRQQTMFNDLYLQLDYTRGPWVLTAGDRLRLVNYWHRTCSTGDNSLWTHHRTENSYTVSAGYKTGGHFVQAMFNHDYYQPLIGDLYGGYDEGLRRNVYKTGYSTNMVYRTEARYSWQHDALTLGATAYHTWTTDNPVADERKTGLRAAVTWNRGLLQLTAGAEYAHVYAHGDDYDGTRHHNQVSLRLLPTLLMGGGWRISSRLLYSNRRELPYELPEHLYASVRVSKSLGRHCTVSAEMHDLAGTPPTANYLVGTSYDNRALTLGLTYRY